MKFACFIAWLSCLVSLPLWSMTPVPYSGKVAINTVNYHGNAEFTFSLHDGNGTTHWRNGADANQSIQVFVRNGRYSVLLGGQGMNTLPPDLFLNHDELYLKVEFDNGDGAGLRHLAPDQLITATPRALVAEWAKMAKLAEGVPAGSITRDMLSQQVLTQLDANGSSASVGPITRDMLPASVLNDLNKTIVITRDMLPQDVQDDLNQSIVITRDMLPQDVQDDLNKTIIITRSMLPADVLNDLNHSISAGSISLNMLAPEIRNDLNRTITKSMLGSDVLADLNKTVTITRDMLPQDVRDDLNKTITITRNMLPADVLSDLNRTISKNNLGSDVLSDLNSSISLNRLSPEVLAALQVTPSISTEPFARYDWRTDSATVEARGRGHNLSYQWLKNGQVISGANAPVLELSNPVLDDNATYSVQLTNSVGQTTSQTITLQQAIGAPGLPLEEANATQVPRNGLVFWLDANDLNADGLADNVLNGASIDCWTDKISKNKAEQDDLNKEPTKGISGIVFSLNHSLVIGDLNTSAKHIFIVGKRKYRQGWSFLIKGKDINQVRWYHNMSDISGDGGTTEFTYGTGGSRRISGGFTSLPLDETFIVTLTKGNHSLDGGLFADLTIGSGLDGEISEILFYDRFLQNNERDAVERYLADKWGIQLYLDKLAAEQAAYDAAVPPAEPENGLQAYYKFEPLAIEPEKVWDYSGNGKHLTMSGFGGNRWVDGVDGKALAFNGSARADRSDSETYASTIAMWINPSVPIDGRNDPNKVFEGESANHHRKFSLNSTGSSRSGHFNYSYTGEKWTASATGYDAVLKGWTHVCLSYASNQDQYEIYVNSAKINVYSPGTQSHQRPGRFRYSNPFSIGYGQYRGEIDEFRMYSTSLTPAQVEGLYLQVQNPILRMAPEHNATVGTNFSLSLAADNGPTTYLAEGLPAGLSLNTTTGQITGSLSQPGYHRVFVKAMNEHGTGSDTIAIVARPQTDQYGWPVDVPDGSDIPQNGLVLWLDANDVDADGEFDTSTDHQKLSNWADKAGMDHNATQATVANQPEIRAGQLAAKPNLNLLVFDGNQSLAFSSINQLRTCFRVIERGDLNDDHSTSLDGGSNLWGRHQYHKIISSIDPRFTNGLQRRDGLPVNFNGVGSFKSELQVITLRSTDFLSAEIIGKKKGTGGYFHGKYGEILVYDRALSTTEIETVEKYLGQKWGISISHDTTPSPTGNPSTFTVTPANDSVTTAHLSEQILKYLKPEITAQPQAKTVSADSNVSYSVTAEGKYLSYQWKKDGSNLTGETNATLNITDANATLHDGNYSVVVSNDFGSVESGVVEVLINTWNPTSISGMKLWLDASELTSPNSLWLDKSGNANNASQNGSPTIIEGAQNGKSIMRYSGTLGEYHSFNQITDIRTVFWVIRREGVTGLRSLLGDDTFSYFHGGTDNKLFYPTAVSNFNLLRINGLVSAISSSTFSSSFTIISLKSNDALSASNFSKDRSFNDRVWKGDLGELMIFSSELTVSDFEKLEGYLALKWGLVNNLPADHPYKNNAP